MIDLLVIQPTPFCNIDCTYCYLPNRNNSKKITLETLEKILDQVLHDNLIKNELCIVWHAGEPLTITVEYFSKMLIFIENKLKGIPVFHSIQTNGMLISQAWCDLINQYKIRIGISVDGPEEINDSNRKSRSGKGTLKKSLEGIALLQQNSIPYHAIAVITEKSLSYPDEIFHFFKSNGFYHLGLNIEEVEGVNTKSSIKREDLGKRVKTFYQRLFDLYLQSDGSMKLREFDTAFNAVLRNPQIPDITSHKIYSHQTSPLGIISIDYEGNFSTFSPELLGNKHERFGDFNLGNVFLDTFIGSLKSKKFEIISLEIEKGIRQCKKECEYFYLCGGGAPSNKLYENGSFNSTETMYCKYSIQTPIDIVLTQLEKELEIAET